MELTPGTANSKLLSLLIYPIYESTGTELGSAANRGIELERANSGAI